jgi:nucleoside-diphosphate-sugar epimerase
MNILITGAFGFVGSNLSKALKKTGKHYLIAIDITEPENHFFEEYHSWNDLSNVDWGQVDTIIHLAGKAHDTSNTTEEKAYFEINWGLTKKIFEYFLQSNTKKFIHFSSVKAVTDRVKGDYLSEDEWPAPITPYGKSKLEAEKYILSQFLEEKKKIYILRPCMIHGPGNKGNLNLLYKIVQKGLPWPLGAFNNKRSFTSIDNLTYMVTQIIEKDIESGIYQIADNESLSTNELIRLIAEGQKRKPNIWIIPKIFIQFIAKVGDILRLPLNSERLNKLTESYVVSNQKIMKAVGIEKLPVTAKEGFIKTFESFQN